MGFVTPAGSYEAPRTGYFLHEDIFDHAHFDLGFAKSVEAFIDSQERLELRTVGIDIGSSTSHLLFAKIVLEREANDLSSRYVVRRRDIVWRSPILLTPFRSDGTIDAAELGRFIDSCYQTAGTTPASIDSGAVILTGEAIKKTNAAAIDQLFAEQAGKFVCASAGHMLEATLTAHGSGAVAYSQSTGSAVLHVDIGGGTTKLALIDRGEIVDVSAFAVGGRLIADDGTGAIVRIDDTARLLAHEMGIPATPASFGDPEIQRRLAARLADLVIDQVTGAPLDDLGRTLLLTSALRRTVRPAAITFAGGVAEYIFKRQSKTFGDIAPLLAEALRTRFATCLDVPVVDPGSGIRATVLGASQFTVQVSGKTIFISNDAILPLRNVPVVRFDLPAGLDARDLEGALRHALERAERDREKPLAISFSWTRAPIYGDLIRVARALRDAFATAERSPAPLILLIDGDVGKTMGHLVHEELAIGRGVISIDGVDLRDFDFVDVGELLTPPGVIPLVIKSLLFR